MKHADIKAMMAEIAPVIREFTLSALAPVAARLDTIEQRLAALPTPRDGKDADEGAIAVCVAERMAAELAEIRASIAAVAAVAASPDVKGVLAAEIEAIRAEIEERQAAYGSKLAEVVLANEAGIARAKADMLAAIPDAPDVAGAITEVVRRLDDQRAQDTARVDALIADVEAKILTLPVPQDGKDADPEEVRALVLAEIERAVSAIPVPKDGKSISADDVAPIIRSEVVKAVSAIPVPKDGCGIKELLIDRAGALVATMDDGRVKSLGRVEGRDAADVDMPAVERMIAEKVAAIPAPKDGLDGVGFDDMACEIRDDGVYLVFEKGAMVKEARLPIPLDMGVYKADAPYKRGACVTWGGSVWIAQKDSPGGKPDAPGSDWRLAVKRGRDGKDAEKKS